MILTGDIVIHSNLKAGQGKLTAMMSGGPGTHASCGIYTDAIWEARSNGIKFWSQCMRVSSWEARREDMDRRSEGWSVWRRDTPLTPAEESRMQVEADKRLKTLWYSPGELVLCGLDWERCQYKQLDRLSYEAIHARRLGEVVKQSEICSKAVMHLELDTHVVDAPKWSIYWTPNDMLEWLRRGNGWHPLAFSEKWPSNYR